MLVVGWNFSTAGALMSVGDWFLCITRLRTCTDINVKRRFDIYGKNLRLELPIAILQKDEKGTTS